MPSLTSTSSALDQWQARLDADFPQGCLLTLDTGHPETDPTDITARLVVAFVQAPSVPAVAWASAHREMSFWRRFTSYEQILDSPRVVRVSTAEGDTWLLSSNLPTDLLPTLVKQRKEPQSQREFYVQ